MAKIKYYRYALKEEGRFPKTGFVREEKAPEGYYAMAAYTTILPDSTVKKYNLVDLNEDVRYVSRLRIRAGLTQREMAEKIGIPYRTYQNWEINGMEGAILGGAVKLADFYGIKDLRDLLK